MTTPLSPENEAFVREEIARGVFQNWDEAIDASVTLMKEWQRLRHRLAESRRQLDAGEHVEYDDESLRRMFDGLKERARLRAEANRAKS
jgi:Arc/MetJ-type ribon-helix-helix transcriptional regulator